MNRQDTSQVAHRSAPTSPLVAQPSYGPRTWNVLEWIGENEVLLGTVTAVHHARACVNAFTQFRVFDTERQGRIRVIVKRDEPNELSQF